MKVILQEDVRNLGKVGDVLKVADGYARNFLLPRKLAVEATEKRVKEWTHLNKVAEAKKKKAVVQRKEVLDKLVKETVNFKADTAEGSDKLFGAVTNSDVAEELVKMGYNIDRKEIVLEGPIRILGQHKAKVKLGEGLEAEIKISVERKG
jgi:large subunit ribosomal protein L9